MDQIITKCLKSLKEKVKKAVKLEIALLEQEIKDNYIEVIGLIPGGFVINASYNTKTNTVISVLMDSYHERLLNRTRMDLTQFNEAYKSKHFLATFPPALPVVSTFIISAQLSAKHRSKTEKLDANNVSTFVNQEYNHHPPQQQTFDERTINSPAFETEYQDFAPLKRTI